MTGAMLKCCTMSDTRTTEEPNYNAFVQSGPLLYDECNSIALTRNHCHVAIDMDYPAGNWEKRLPRLEKYMDIWNVDRRNTGTTY